MRGVYLTGHGGVDKLDYCTTIPVPTPGPGEVLIRVKSSSVNNTDINTRVGWYSKAVTTGTDVSTTSARLEPDAADASWSGAPLIFPRIQGADCCGDIVETGDGVARHRIGERVLVRSMMPEPEQAFECRTFGSEIDGGFAEYAVAPARDTFAIDSDLDDASLGVIPCAYSTAEGMLVRANVTENDRVLILGASGGVGSAAVQLASLRNADVVAVAAAEKGAVVKTLGAGRIIERGAKIRQILGDRSVDVIVDLVGGDGFTALPDLLKKGGRYITAGAIAGPMVTMDLRTLYLNDLTFFGSTFQTDIVFKNVIEHINAGKIRPKIAKTYTFSQIREAQQVFLEKSFVGKISLVPDGTKLPE